MRTPSQQSLSLLAAIGAMVDADGAQRSAWERVTEQAERAQHDATVEAVAAYDAAVEEAERVHEKLTEAAWRWASALMDGHAHAEEFPHLAKPARNAERTRRASATVGCEHEPGIADAVMQLAVEADAAFEAALLREVEVRTPDGDE